MSGETKTYWPRSGAKQIDFANGGNILKLNFHVETAISWLKEHANDQGYITVGVSRRRAVGERGETHCLWLDTWKPDASKAKAAADRAQQRDQPPFPGDDSVPF